MYPWKWVGVQDVSCTSLPPKSYLSTLLDLNLYNNKVYLKSNCHYPSGETLRFVLSVKPNKQTLKVSPDPPIYALLILILYKIVFQFLYDYHICIKSM